MSRAGLSQCLPPRCQTSHLPRQQPLCRRARPGRLDFHCRRHCLDQRLDHPKISPVPRQQDSSAGRDASPQQRSNRRSHARARTSSRPPPKTPASVNATPEPAGPARAPVLAPAGLTATPEGGTLIRWRTPSLQRRALTQKRPPARFPARASVGDSPDRRLAHRRAPHGQGQHQLRAGAATT